MENKIFVFLHNNLSSFIVRPDMLLKRSFQIVRNGKNYLGKKVCDIVFFFTFVHSEIGVKCL